MIDTAYRATLFGLYQLSIVLGIALLPLALLTSRVGFTLPVHRLVDRLQRAHERASQA